MRRLAVAGRALVILIGFSLVVLGALVFVGEVGPPDVGGLGIAGLGLALAFISLEAHLGGTDSVPRP